MEIVMKVRSARLLISITALLAAVTTAAVDRHPVRNPGTPGEDAAGSGQMLVVLELRPESETALRAELAARGSTVLRTLDGSSVLVASLPSVHESLEGILGVFDWRPEEAISEVLKHLSPTDAGRFAGGVPVILGLAPGAAPAAVVEALEDRGAIVRWTDSRGQLTEVGLLAQADHLDEVIGYLGGLSTLVWADLQPPIRLRNSDSVWRCQSGGAAQTPVFDHGLHGEGQIIAVMDTGIDVDHCFFDDPDVGLPAMNDDQGTEVSPLHRKILAVDFYWDQDWPDPGSGDWDNHDHGTHVAGSAAGDEHGDGLHRGFDGMAPAARLVIQDGGFAVDDCADLPGLGCPVRPLEPMLQQAYDQGARIHSDSWGDEENFLPFNRYTERTADIDRFQWEHKDFLVFIAGGNSGSGAGTIGSPATGKNVVGVGATLHGHVEPTCVVSFSSRGWTLDGRIKPDLVVPGSNILSANNDGVVPSASCTTRSMSGTSMATPTAAGLAALVRQYYQDGFYPGGAASKNGFQPSGALVKATLIASAVDLSTLGCSAVDPIPSRDQGWGLVQLDRALAFPGSEHILVVDDHRTGFSSPAGDPVRLPMLMTERTALKVVVVWTDPPSTSSAETNLVNDLDLKVTGPSPR